MTDETNPNGTETTSTPPQPSWFIDEGIPGVGDRPAWLGDKFKTVKDLANSYSELEKRFGTPPEDYDLSKSTTIDPEYAAFQDLKQFAKEKRVSQEVMDKFLETFDKYNNQFTIDMKEETKKLGENAKNRLDTVDNWAKANLSKEAYEALTGEVRTAEGFKALEELRSKMMSNATLIPNGNDSGSSSGAATLEDLQKELSTNLAKYKTDAAYRKDYQTRLEIATKNSEFVDKKGG